MKHSGIKLFSILLLSISSFISVSGALLSILWLSAAVIAGRMENKIRILPAAAVILISAAAALLLEFRNGGLSGLYYFIRMAGVIMTAFYAYAAVTQRDIMNIFTYLFGKRYGFEGALIISAALLRLRNLEREYRLRAHAYRMKKMLQRGKYDMHIPNKRLSLSEYAGLIINVMTGALSDSYRQSEILALRGYSGGGNFKASFEKSRTDSIPAVSAVIIFTISLLVSAGF